MSIIEHSHRGKLYEAVHDEALSLVRELLAVPDTHDILFLQGGATQQFVQVPMNLRKPGQSADYIIGGVWGQKAYKEAIHSGQARIAGTTEVDGKFFRVSKNSELELDPAAAYVHITSNNTVMGTQVSEFPNTGAVPLVCDMSSDIMARKLNVADFGLIYAGAQKNMGPSGVTVVIVKKSLVESGPKEIPYFFQYRTHAAEKSLANTCPTFSIYLMRNTLSWLKDQGGVPFAEVESKRKAGLLYSVLESRPDFYRLSVERESRSVMNVVWNLPTPELDAECVAAATAKGLVGLKGHRIVGGMRASIYNAVPYESVEALAEFLTTFGR
jgi:phosphoserine aminotransferase